MLETRRAGELAEPLDSTSLDDIVSDLRRHVTDLERRGVDVVFFEMPEHAKFREMPRPTSVRQRLHEAFPASRYSWVTQVDHATYRTTDFVHLTAAGSKRYAEVLKAHVASLSPTAAPAMPATVATPAAPGSSARAE